MTSPLDLVFRQLPRSADAVLVVPPLLSLRAPLMSVHLLQACAERAGFGVSVLYGSFLLAAMIGHRRYEALCNGLDCSVAMGERLFAADAWGVPSLGRDGDQLFEGYDDLWRDPATWYVPPEELREVAAAVREWGEVLSDRIAELDVKVVGCSTTFHQTSAAAFLLREVKRRRPDIITVVGGGNCSGEMAEGVLSLGADFDYVFAGESEQSWPEFLELVKRGELPARRIVAGTACFDLDALPTPSYAQFHAQRSALLPEVPEAFWLTYESSRGCWWGEKSHCAFCGITDEIRFREKSPDRVLSELRQLVQERRPSRIYMTDNIMPRRYFGSVLPALRDGWLSGVEVFFQEKANLTLREVMLLKDAGVTGIQAGMEALSTPLLKRMGKGLTARQNIALLRYARSVDLPFLAWNVLYNLPGDEPADWQLTAQLLPLLRHLHPPARPTPLSIDRFSPYFERYEDFGLSNLRAKRGYAACFPQTCDIDKLAYNFEADYQSASRDLPEVAANLESEVRAWRRAWFQGDAPPPSLKLQRAGDDLFLLADTRGLPGAPEVHMLDARRAREVMTDRPFSASDDIIWAVGNRLGVELDGRYVPLATAEPQLLLQFESRSPVSTA